MKREHLYKKAGFYFTSIYTEVFATMKYVTDKNCGRGRAVKNGGRGRAVR